MQTIKKHKTIFNFNKAYIAIKIIYKITYKLSLRTTIQSINIMI